LRRLGFAARDPETNIVLASVPDVRRAMQVLAGVGVLVTPAGSAIRFVTHRDLDERDIEGALARISPVADVVLAATPA
jgi:threonine aldolase